MFSGCRLNKKSVLAIVKTLQEDNQLTGSAGINLGVDKSLQTDEEMASLQNAIITSAAGGTWTISIQWTS